MKRIILFFVAAALTVGYASAQSVKFESDYDQAMARASKENKPLFLVVVKQNNNLSKSMTDGVFTDEQVGAKYNDGYVSLLLWEDSAKGREIMRDYTFGYTPAYLILSPKGDLINKDQGQKDRWSMVEFADKALPGTERLAELNALWRAGTINRDELKEFISLGSSLGMRNDKALDMWLAEGPVDADTYALITGQDGNVESAGFKYLAAHADEFMSVEGEKPVNYYLYTKYHEQAQKNKGYINALRTAGYPYADALEQNLSLNLRKAQEDAAVRAQIDKLTDDYPVTAPMIGSTLMRGVSIKDPEFDRYVDGIAAKAAAYVPEVGVRIARYIANNYLIVNADPMAANPWVDRYLEWSGDPNYEPKITRFVKEAVGEWKFEGYGRVMPDVEMKDLEGNTVKISDLRGEFVLIDFWASWCGPCRAEIPHVKEVYERVKAAPVKFLSVSIDKSDVAWKKAAEQMAMPWLNVTCNGTEMQKEYGVRDIPRIMILDPEGRLVGDNLTSGTIETQLARLGEEYGFEW